MYNRVSSQLELMNKMRIQDVSDYPLQVGAGGSDQTQLVIGRRAGRAWQARRQAQQAVGHLLAARATALFRLAVGVEGARAVCRAQRGPRVETSATAAAAAAHGQAPSSHAQRLRKRAVHLPPRDARCHRP